MPGQRKLLEPKNKEAMLIKKQEKHESLSGALAGMKPGETRVGYLGEGNITRKPDYEPELEVLDTNEATRKRAIQGLLLKYIAPNELSSRSNPELNRKSLVNKLNRLTLPEMTRFLPARLKRMSTEQLDKLLSSEEDRVGEVEIVEIQDNYREISP